MHLTSEGQVRRLSQTEPVVYIVFDLLFLDGHALFELPYADRRKLLTQLMPEGPTWQVPAHHVGHGEALREASRAQGLEGIVAKRLDSTYLPGRRTKSWVKVKNVRRTDVVIGGWKPGDGGRANTRRLARRGHLRRRRAQIRRQRRHRVHPGRAQARRRPSSSRSRARRARSAAPSRRRARASSSRSWSRRSTTARSPASARCATRSTRVCATISTRSRSGRPRSERNRTPDAAAIVRMNGWRDPCGAGRSPSGSSTSPSSSTPRCRRSRSASTSSMARPATGSSRSAWTRRRARRSPTRTSSRATSSRATATS